MEHAGSRLYYGPQLPDPLSPTADRCGAGRSPRRTAGPTYSNGTLRGIRMEPDHAPSLGIGNTSFVYAMSSRDIAGTVIPALERGVFVRTPPSITDGLGRLVERLRTITAASGAVL